jgi:hypothetical protein
MKYVSRYVLGAMMLNLAALGCAHAEEPAMPSPFGKSETALAFAIDQGCLTYFREGGAIKPYVERYARTITEDGKQVQKIYGGHVTVSEDERGGCYIRVQRGNGASLRDTALKTLRDKGFRLESFADYEPYVKTRDWSYLQELYCWRQGAEVYNILISSSAISRKVTLQATLLKDTEGTSVKKGLCLS